MGMPIAAPAFRAKIHFVATDVRTLAPSDGLADLLSAAREQYVWKGKTAKESQAKIMWLEHETACRLANLDGANARWICLNVSEWGGNNDRALGALANGTSEQTCRLTKLISQLLMNTSIKDTLRELAKQPGLNLVMASKIYRFCSPQTGAALDRHSSYFFNSLPMQGEAGSLRPCTQFARQWANGKHRTSRLDIYSSSSKHEANLNEYCDTYLLLLRKLADALNTNRGGFRCAASGERRAWRPADVEMGAYFWWSRNVPQYH